MGGLIFLFSCMALARAYHYYLYDDPHTMPDRQTMVHLFEWKWTDIAAECENFLQFYGYGAVQISPPHEHLVYVENNNAPWYLRYQPVSYKLTSRSGTEDEFKDMVERCNKVGVRIIADVVMNQMVGYGQKSGGNGRSGSAGSSFDTTHGALNFPGVPYTKEDFNDHRCLAGIYGYGNVEEVRNCRLLGLVDVDQGNPHVRKVLTAFLDKMIDYGVAGFRVDAAKHMWPGDLLPIFNGVKNLREDIFGPDKRPFLVNEVIDRGGEAAAAAQYLGIGRYTDFNYGPPVSAAARGDGDWAWLARLGPGYGYGNYEDHDVLSFIDNHDNQRDWHPSVLNHKDGDRYRLAVSFMLAWPYGYPRVMSSYYFHRGDQGPPTNEATDHYTISSPTFNSHDDTCNATSGWVCEHRWPTIREMVKFRSAVQGTAATRISTEHRRIAFARKGKGFFAVNGRGDVWKRFFETTMPAGDYCDQYAGRLEKGKCTGQTINVRRDGSAYLRIGGGQAVAFSLASRIGEAPPSSKKPSGYTKTVVLIKKNTYQGQFLFLRGGTSHANYDECYRGPHQQAKDRCAIPIIHNTTVPFVYAGYLSWSQGDDFLDFEGPEEEQGTRFGEIASGTPMVYSSNNTADYEYQPYNKYGVGYWLVELLVDCSRTDEGWFELKGYQTPTEGWEPNVSQGKCTGSIGGSAPFKSYNHIAKCGAVNVFKWGSGECIIDPV